MNSIRRRLLGSVMTAIVVAALFQAASAYRGALQQADEMFDYHLQQMALALRNGAPNPSAPEDPEEAEYEVQIWSPTGVQLFQSHRNRLPPQAVLGFSDVEQNGTHYRVYSIQTPMQTIQIAQDLSARQARARALAVRAMLPMAIMAPLLMAALWWAIRHALKPLEHTRQQVAARVADEQQRSGSAIDVGQGPPAIGRWDRQRLDQVITNLLTNAVRYGQGRPVAVVVEAGPGLVRLRVRDQGIGIALQDQKRIFERFERAAPLRNYGGVGLGLWIVHELVAALGGTVSVASETGKGATFTVELPTSGPQTG